MTQTECVIHCFDFIPLEEDETLGKTNRQTVLWGEMNVDECEEVEPIVLINEAAKSLLSC